MSVKRRPASHLILLSVLTLQFVHCEVSQTDVVIFVTLQFVHCEVSQTDVVIFVTLQFVHCEVTDGRRYFRDVAVCSL